MATDKTYRLSPISVPYFQVLTTSRRPNMGIADFLERAAKHMEDGDVEGALAEVRI